MPTSSGPRCAITSRILSTILLSSDNPDRLDNAIPLIPHILITVDPHRSVTNSFSRLQEWPAFAFDRVTIDDEKLLWHFRAVFTYSQPCQFKVRKKSRCFNQRAISQKQNVMAAFDFDFESATVL